VLALHNHQLFPVFYAQTDAARCSSFAAKAAVAASASASCRRKLTINARNHGIFEFQWNSTESKEFQNWNSNIF
jgi:hypothetical protein